MSKENHKVIECRNLISDGNGGSILCGGTKHTLSGNNGWTTIQRATKDHPAIKVLKQRFVCKDCGGFNFRHLDGSLIKDEYTEDEIKHLVNLTRQKLFEKENN